MEKVKNRKKTPRRTYVSRPNAIHLTIYSPYGDAVPKAILNEAAEALTQIALDNGLLIGIAET